MSPGALLDPAHKLITLSEAPPLNTFKELWRDYIGGCGIDLSAEPAGRTYRGTKWYDILCSSLNEEESVSNEPWRTIRLECDNPDKAEADRIILFSPPLAKGGCYFSGDITINFRTGLIATNGSVICNRGWLPDFVNPIQISLISDSYCVHQFSLVAYTIKAMNTGNRSFIYTLSVPERGLIPLNPS